MPAGSWSSRFFIYQGPENNFSCLETFYNVLKARHQEDRGDPRATGMTASMTQSTTVGSP